MTDVLQCLVMRREKIRWTSMNGSLVKSNVTLLRGKSAIWNRSVTFFHWVKLWAFSELVVCVQCTAIAALDKDSKITLGRCPLSGLRSPVFDIHDFLREENNNRMNEIRTLVHSISSVSHSRIAFITTRVWLISRFVDYNTKLLSLSNFNKLD